MKKSFVYALVAAFLLSSCASVPLAGRKRLMLVSETETLQSSLTEYNSYMSTATKSTSKTGQAQVERVGKRIAAAAEKFMNDNGLSADVANYSWEFTLVKDQEINAFCMPGGKIVVYEGLMPLVGCDDDLAVVIGHEVAHAVARHSSERMSQQLLAQYGAAVIGAAVSQKSEMTQQMASVVYGLGAQYGVMLPFSRKHESEADYMGLVFMTLAGYDPEQAVSFWEKMAASSSTSIPAILSSHPSDSQRIADIQKRLPKIELKYK